MNERWVQEHVWASWTGVQEVRSLELREVQA